jgi:uracil-DNA glycosylase family 4
MIIPDLEARLPSKPTALSFDPLQTQCAPTDNVLVAPFVLIGEAPTSIEIMEGEPFVGPSGSQLNRILAAVNLPRYDCYITNACKAMLPNNQSEKLWNDKGWRCDAWPTLQERLIIELEQSPARIIIVMGATAMHLLLDSSRFDKITKFRGSIYSTEEFAHLKNRLPGKFICLTFHPSSCLPHNNPINFYVIIGDLKKFVALNQDPTLLLSEPKTIIRPTFQDVMQWYHKCMLVEVVAFDIEATPRFVTCFSITPFQDSSMSIPLMDNNGNYWSIDEEVEIWKGLARILGDSHIKVICQNGMFDLMFLLRTMSIVTDNFDFDTMIAQHICWTDLPKGLDYLTSAYTYYPYYKDEGKQSHLKVIKDWSAYWTYNAKDTAYLLSIAKKLKRELKDFGPGAESAMVYSMELHKPLMEMEFNGLALDHVGLAKRKQTLYRVINRLQKAIDRLAGFSLNVNSPKQMVEFFYTKMSLPPYIDHKTKRPTCDAVALSRIAKKKRPALAAKLAKIILKLRRYKKLVSTYFEVTTDPDGRIRCAHKITGTVSGRIATAQTFFGTGMNLQNQPPAFKEYIVADSEHLICEVDLAKAEAHVVAFLSGDANMIEAFESGVDVHSFNASKIFDVPIESVSEFQRNLGKKVVHASNYAMGPGTFSNTLAKEDTFISQGDCKILLDAYNARFPGLKLWHKSINQEIYNSRILYNLFGRPKRFLGMLNDALLRNAYSYKPQSTVAELLNRGVIKISQETRFNPTLFDIDLSVTVHDSLLFQIPIKQIKHLQEIFKIIKAHLTHEFFHKGRTFTIGVDFKLGKAWSGNAIELKGIEQAEIDRVLAKLGV